MTERTDEETVELIREFLQKYGLTIIAGIVIGLASVGGYQWWQKRQLEERYQESATLDQLSALVVEEKYNDAEKIYQQLQQAHDNISELAGLVLATGYQQTNQLEKAFSILQTTANEGKDLLVQQTARWRAANIAVSLQKYDEAEALLTILQDSPYAAQAQTLQGDIFKRQGKLSQALKAYTNSLALTPDPSTDLRIINVAAQLALENKKKD